MTAPDDPAAPRADQDTPGAQPQDACAPHPARPPARGSDDQPSDRESAAAAARRRAELDRIFGDVLPETTRDERGAGASGEGGRGGDDWYQRNRPPHHGG